MYSEHLQDIEMEEIVLGALILDSSSILRLTDQLSADTFAEPKHQHICNALISLHKESLPIDKITIIDRLKKDGTLKQAGNMAYIAGLTSKVASSAHLEYHHSCLLALALRRKLIEKAEALIVDAANLSLDIFDTITEYSNLKDIEVIEEDTETLPLKDIAYDTIKEIEQNISLYEKGELPGISSGIQELDAVTSGWRPGDLVVIGARPGVGKTALALSMELQTETPVPTLLFSMEMPKTEIMQRLYAMEHQIDLMYLRRGKDITSSQFDAMGTSRINNLPLYINDKGGVSADYIFRQTHKHIRKHRIKKVIIDHLHLMNSTKSKNNTNDDIADITKSLKMMAMNLEIPVILLAQLNREHGKNADRLPTLTDLRGSGAIEQDANYVLFVHRPYMMQANDQKVESEEAQIIIRKARNSATDIWPNLTFYNPYAYFKPKQPYVKPVTNTPKFYYDEKEEDDFNAPF